MTDPLPFHTQAGLFTYHRSLIADTARMDAFARAIALTVKPGQTVLDLGTGSGVLACLAVRAGAKHVYAVDSGPIIGIARLVARQNGLTDKITFVEEGSLDVQLPEQVDVVISETLGNIGFDEGLLDWMKDARARFLKPGGVLVPRALEMFAAPIEAPEVVDPLDLWSSTVHGVKFDLKDLVMNNVLTVMLRPDALLGPPASLGSIDLRTCDDVVFRGSAELVVERAGTLHGIGGWFAAELADGVSITNAPPNPAPSWSHRFFPVSTREEQYPGDRIGVAIEGAAAGSRWSWDVTVPVCTGKPIVERHATLSGFPLDLGSK